MEFRDLNRQYLYLKEDIDNAISSVLNSSHYIAGSQVIELEKQLAEYVGVKHCITCANGTDALSLALMAWGVKEGDAVFVPDFTFFASAEVISYAGATPIFVDVEENTFNISPDSLTNAIERVIEDGTLVPKVIITVDLFGQPADYDRIIPIAQKYNMKILEDGAQGFGGAIREKKACSFGDIATTSFFPAKPLGCYGDGGALFTNDDEMDLLLRSLCVHGEGENKYDNIRIGRNSRLDTIQAAILNVKLAAFIQHELDDINTIAFEYTKILKNVVKTPTVQEGYLSSWAQYSILLKDKEQRDGLQKYLKSFDIPSKIYYKKPLHRQKAFINNNSVKTDLNVTESLCDRILSLPLHPYMTDQEQKMVTTGIVDFLG